MIDPIDELRRVVLCVGERTREVKVDLLIQVADAFARLQDERDSALRRVTQLEQREEGWQAYLLLLKADTMLSTNEPRRLIQTTTCSASERNGRGDSRRQAVRTSAEGDRHETRLHAVRRQSNHPRKQTS